VTQLTHPSGQFETHRIDAGEAKNETDQRREQDRTRADARRADSSAWLLAHLPPALKLKSGPDPRGTEDDGRDDANGGCLQVSHFRIVGPFVLPESQQLAKNGPEPGDIRPLTQRRRPPKVNAATTSRNLITAGLFVMEPVLAGILRLDSWVGDRANPLSLLAVIPNWHLFVLGHTALAALLQPLAPA
jgi:hypothetical protein